MMAWHERDLGLLPSPEREEQQQQLQQQQKQKTHISFSTLINKLLVHVWELKSSVVTKKGRKMRKQLTGDNRDKHHLYC